MKHSSFINLIESNKIFTERIEFIKKVYQDVKILIAINLSKI